MLSLSRKKQLGRILVTSILLGAALAIIVYHGPTPNYRQVYEFYKPALPYCVALALAGIAAHQHRNVILEFIGTLLLKLGVSLLSLLTILLLLTSGADANTRMNPFAYPLDLDNTGKVSNQTLNIEIAGPYYFALGLIPSPQSSTEAPRRCSPAECTVKLKVLRNGRLVREEEKALAEDFEQFPYESKVEARP